jgi:hypothetical protein
MRLILVIVATAFTLACSRDKNEALQRTQNQTDYYKRIPEIPLELYCKLDESISFNTKKRFCEIMDSIGNNNLSFDFFIEVEEAKVQYVDLRCFYFDHRDRLISLACPKNELTTYIETMQISTIDVLRNETEGAFGFRIQIENFCKSRIF